MIDTWHLPPPRIMAGVGVTLIAALILGVRSCAGGSSGESTTTSASTVVSTTVAVLVEETTSTSISLAPDWYPKQSSRYSDRRPVVTVTTLAPTTTTRPTTIRPNTSRSSSSGPTGSVPQRASGTTGTQGD